jgi:O-antigen ligase
MNSTSEYAPHRVSEVGVVVTMFGAATSISLVSIGYGLLLLGFVLERSYALKIRRFFDSPLAVPLCALILWALVGASYSDAPTETLHRQMAVFLRLTFAFLVFVAITRPALVKTAWYSFFGGAIVTVVSSFANVYVNLPWSVTQALGWGADHTVFYNYIWQSLIMAFTAAVALVVALRESSAPTWQRLLCGLLAALCVSIILVLSKGRMGMVAFVLAGTYILWWRFRVAGLLAGGVLFAGALWIIWNETEMGLRLADGLAGIVHFNGLQNSMTSWGARLSMYLLSLRFISDAPIFGHGLGDYQTLAMAFYDKAAMRSVAGYHPHNQYLYLGVELGLIGLGIYLSLHWRIWRVAESLSRTWGAVIKVFLIMLIVDSMFHAPFWMAGERNFFFPMLGLIAATGVHGVIRSEK